jgi:hypothetical protein
VGEHTIADIAELFDLVQFQEVGLLHAIQTVPTPIPSTLW